MRMRMPIVRQLMLSATMITGLFLGGVLSPQAATAATYYVATDGNDANPCTQSSPCQTIAQGLSRLQSGDTLYLRGGTYDEDINTNNVTVPSGTSWSNATVIASAPGETAILAPTQATGSVVVGIAAPYVILDRLVLDAANTRYGLSTSQSTYIRFQNGEIKNSGTNLPHHTPFDPSLDEAENVEMGGAFNEVIHSKIYASPRSYGFYVTGHDNLIDGNEIHDNGGFGIHIYEGSFPTVTTDNHIVRDNIMYNNGFYRGQGAITLGQGSNCLVYNNTIYDNFGGIDVYKGGTNENIDNNTLYNNGWGIKVFASNTEAIIQNNIVHQDGLPIGYAIDNVGFGTVLRNNTIIE